MTDPSHSQIREQLHKGLTELQALRDEIRVRIHLATMEAKDSWNDLEPQVLRLEEQIRETADVSLHAVRDRIGEVSQSLRHLRSKLG